jgi:hypothetical protein
MSYPYTVSTTDSLVQIDTRTATGNVLINLSSFTSRNITIRDIGGSASFFTTSRIQISTLNGYTFNDMTSSHYITQPYGFITVRPSMNQWNIQTEYDNAQYGTARALTTNNIYINGVAVLTATNAVTNTLLTSTAVGLGSIGYVSSLVNANTLSSLQGNFSSVVIGSQLTVGPSLVVNTSAVLISTQLQLAIRQRLTLVGCAAGGSIVYNTSSGWNSTSTFTGQSTSFATNGSIIVCSFSGAPYTAYSNNGSTWTNGSGISVAINKVIWDGKQFIAAGGAASTASLFTSPDGINWTTVTTSGLTNVISALGFNGSWYVAGTSAGGIFYTNNLTSWSSSTTLSLKLSVLLLVSFFVISWS